MTLIVIQKCASQPGFSLTNQQYIAQALPNAVLVMHIDHWVMENDFSKVGRISENPCLARSPRYEILDIPRKNVQK